MSRSSVSSKGQATIPKDVREHLKLKPGDQIEFVIQADGSVRLEPATVDLRSLKGCLSAYVKKPVTLEAMKAAVAKRFRNS
jgi:antitoxin PrlF